MIHQDREHRRVASLSGTDQDDQRESAAINEMMDLRRQSAPGSADSVISGLLAQILVTRKSPLCHGEGSLRAGAHG